MQLDSLRAVVANDKSGAEVERLLRAVFSSPESLNRSFVKVW
jgi:hypothetical protein